MSERDLSKDNSSVNTNIEDSGGSNLNANDQDCLQILESRDYYSILNINHNASEEEVKRSYKKVIVKYHPDKNQSVHASEAFKKVSHVYQVLSDSEKRAFYDRYGTEEEHKARMESEMDEFDLFDSIFNQRPIRRNKKEKEKGSVKYAIIQLVFTLAMFYFYNYFLIKPTDKSTEVSIFITVLFYFSIFLFKD